MNNIKFILFILVTLLSTTLTSCSSSQSFFVQGVPGTIIANPQNQQIAVIDNSGQTKIKMKRKQGYTHYLQALTPGSNILVPFALDYKNHSRATGRDLEAWGGAFIMALGAGSGMVAGAMALGGDFSDAGGGAFLGAGLGGLLVGGIMMGDGMSKDGIDYDYDYKKIQTTNADIIR